MHFNVWFRKWANSFFKLLSFDTTPKRTKAQRKKEHAQRLKAKRSSINRYRIKKIIRRRNSHTVQNERLIRAVLRFSATTLAVILLPFGLLDWVHKNQKAKKAPKAGDKTQDFQKESAKATTSLKAAAEKASPSSFPAKEATAPSSHTDTGSPPIEQAHRPETTNASPPSDEKAPKSTPKNENDQYIRKRMMIAGSRYCDAAAFDTLVVGAYIDLEAEPDNPHDKDAVKLLYNGEKIGYIAKQDRLPFVSCLKLGRKIYGVITAIFEEDGRAKYEYEAWFDNAKESRCN